MGSGRPKPLGSVSRALAIVEFLAGCDIGGASLARVATTLGINKATAYNTLATLRLHEWAEQDPETGFYRLGEGIAPVVRYRNAIEGIVERLHPTLVAVSTRFNELVHLGRLAGHRVVYLDKVEPDRTIRVVSRIGRQVTAVRTSLGRALIGVMPNREQQLQWFFSDPELPLDDPEALAHLRQSLEENFERLDSQGWTQEIGENESGIACVAVPLRIEGGPMLAISISTPIERMSRERRPELARGIAEEIAKIPHVEELAVSSRVLDS